MAAQCDVISKLPRRVGSQPGGRRAGEGGWDRQDEVAVQEVARRELLEALVRLQSGALNHTKIGVWGNTNMIKYRHTRKYEQCLLGIRAGNTKIRQKSM